MSAPGRVRIGQLSRRTGVSVDVLRVWERRYGVLSPARTPGGQRLYSREDERRIRAMVEHVENGVSPAEAARLVTTGGRSAAPADLAAALDSLDEPGAHAELDRVFSELGIERALSEVVIPYLRQVGERWAVGDMTVAEEHFVSRLLHARLLGAARGWDAGNGRRALLACPPGEEHDLPLIAFGLVLRRRGWRITYLGANTPIGAIADLAGQIGADAVVLAATTPPRFAGVIDALRDLGTQVPLYLAGAGAGPKLAADAGARLIDRDPVSGAAELAEARRV